MRVRYIAAEGHCRASLRRGLAALLIPILIVGGCASDEPPPFQSPASAAYRADLESCRSAVAAARDRQHRRRLLHRRADRCGSWRGRRRSSRRRRCRRDRRRKRGRRGRVLPRTALVARHLGVGLHAIQGLSPHLGLGRRRTQRQLERDRGGAGNSDQTSRREDESPVTGAADRRRHAGLHGGVGERCNDDRDGGDEGGAAALRAAPSTS